MTNCQITLSMISFSTCARDSILVPTSHVFSTRNTGHVPIAVLVGRNHINIDSRIAYFSLYPGVDLVLGPLGNISKMLEPGLSVPVRRPTNSSE